MWMNEWMNERINERTNESINQSTNQCAYKKMLESHKTHIADDGRQHEAGIHNPRADPASERVISGPRNRLKKYKKLLLNDGDFLNEFNVHWTVNNFAAYHNPKQFWWQQYQTTGNKKASCKNKSFYYLTLESSAHNFVFGPRIH